MRKSIRWGLRLFLVLLLVCGVALWTGALQTWSIVWGAKVAFGAVVEVEGAQYWGDLRFDTIRVYPSAAALAADQPLAVAQDVDVVMSGESTRRISELNFGALLLGMSR